MIEGDLGIGADIQRQGGALRLVGFRRQDHRDMVGADVPGDIGRQIDIRPGVQLQSQVAGAQVERLAGSRHVGGMPELFDRQPGEQVVHGRVAHHHRIHHLGGLQASLGAHLGDHLIEGLDQAALQDLAPIGEAAGIADAADHVLAVGDLRVHRAGLGQGIAAVQVHQVSRQLGGAHIHRQPCQDRPNG